MILIKTIDRIKDAFKNDRNSLDLSSQQIEDRDLIKLFQRISKIKRLTSLNLSRNKLVDSSALVKLNRLELLNLSDNNIKDISFIKDMKNLTSLQINKNSELNLPKHLKDKLILDKHDIEEIFRYYEQLENEGKDFIYEAKVLIVGEPKAGKTTLFRKLQNFDYLPQEATEEEKESTIGVNIEILEFPYDKDNYFKAHLWDFGGQEKQYVLHQYFFTERSLYILLADDRKEFGNFNYWFEIIATLGSGCPVLVVLNEINSKVQNFDISVYKREFGEKILEIEEKSVNFSFDEDGRFKNLSNEIKTKLANLQHIGQPLPVTWVKVRQELTEIKEPTISLDDYNKICEKSGVNKNEYRKQILEYLHDLGIALNYKNDDNLRNKLILKPNWVIDALYAVLKDEQIIGNSGKFSADEVFNLWVDYKADEKTILLQLMLKGKFEVAYKLDAQNSYIAPILLPEIAPIYPFYDANSLQIHFVYTFKPKGIISRLIVRFHENIVVNEKNEEQIVWKKGVLLKYNNSTARIIESEQRRRITITVSGKSAFENREFITIISNQIKKIHHDWFENRLQFEEKIPCYCEVCELETEPQFYELNTVKSYYEMDLEMPCDKSVKAKSPQRVNPRKLLEGVYIEESKNSKNDFFGQNNFHIAGDLHISNVSGEGNQIVQGVKNSSIKIQEIGQFIDAISLRMNDSQKQLIENIADALIVKIESKINLNESERDKLEEIKKEGNWETKIKFSLPLIPLEFTKDILPDEFISKVQNWFYGDDLQTNLFESREKEKVSLIE